MKCAQQSASLRLSLANAASRQNAECNETNVRNTLGNAKEIVLRPHEGMHKEIHCGTQKEKAWKGQEELRGNGGVVNNILRSMYLQRY